MLNVLFRMSLEYDPEFVDSKVDILQSDINRLETNFVRTSGRVIDIQSKIASKVNYLRSVRSEDNVIM